MKTPKFLRDLITSPEYMDKNSKVYAMAEKYLNLLYPGTAQTDATGRMTEPEYDSWRNLIKRRMPWRPHWKRLNKKPKQSMKKLGKR